MYTIMTEPRSRWARPEPSYSSPGASSRRFSNDAPLQTNQRNAPVREPGTMASFRRASDVYREQKGTEFTRHAPLQEDDFPAFPSKKATLPTAVPAVTPAKPTFAQLATEWTKKLQDEKAEQEAAAIAEAKRLAEEQRDKDNGLMERIKRINLVKKNNQKKDTRQLDIGCASSDHSENEAYNSQDDLTYEEEEDEDEEDEEDGDALWNYRRNKNEMY